MEQEELNTIIGKHRHYLSQDCEGWEGMRANLSYYNLRGVNLRYADLSDAILSHTDLSGADLCNANLRGANLYGATLFGVNLYCANLSDTNLSGTDIGNADLRGAVLNCANLRCANLCNADLRNAHIDGANLNNAELFGIKISGVTYNEHTAFFASVCPEEGSFIGWKKVGDVIVKMRVPAKAKRSSATTRRCRCEYAKVLELQNLNGTPYKGDKVVNKCYTKTIYKVGEVVRPDSWDDNRWNEYSHGIHFFMTRGEAVMY